MKNKKIMTILIDQETFDTELTNYYTDLSKERAIVAFPELAKEISEAVSSVKVVYRDSDIDESKTKEEIQSLISHSVLNPDHFLVAICTQKNNPRNPDTAFYLLMFN